MRAVECFNHNLTLKQTYVTDKESAAINMNLTEISCLTDMTPNILYTRNCAFFSDEIITM